MLSALLIPSLPVQALLLQRLSVLHLLPPLRVHRMLVLLRIGRWRGLLRWRLLARRRPAARLAEFRIPRLMELIELRHLGLGWRPVLPVRRLPHVWRLILRRVLLLLRRRRRRPRLLILLLL